jgi:hypothetical protein
VRDFPFHFRNAYTSASQYVKVTLPITPPAIAPLFDLWGSVIVRADNVGVGDDDTDDIDVKARSGLRTDSSRVYAP